jgi:glycyl-tRNA synthetase beta chain
MEAFAAERVQVEEDQVDVWVTPRRIAVHIRHLAEQQPPEETAERGPAADAAFDADGAPTKAAEGFARAKGVNVEQLEVREHQGREFVFAVHRDEGRRTVAAIPAACERILRSLSFPRTMRWDASGLRFSRPVRWLVAKYGSETVAFTCAGIEAGETSYGNRYLSSPPVTIGDAGSYLEELAGAAVVADQEERKRLIEEGLREKAESLDADYADPAGELDEVLYLVESPSVEAGSFAEEHLRLPDRVLVTAMQSHQRYFPLVDSDGALKNGFLYVMNGDPAHAGLITTGNERILTGRIEDAEFSFQRDLEEGIESMASRLDAVVFHRRLGSLREKTERLVRLSGAFARAAGLGPEDTGILEAAAALAKADLVSVMVQEFPELEGYMGSVYAEMEGYPAEQCRAVADHYLPVSSGGELPRNRAGAALAVCDKLDNIVGAFSVDEQPTGSRDPYGLRRAAVGIAAISRRFGLEFELGTMLSTCHNLYIEQKADIDRSASLVEEMTAFIIDRVQHRMVEQGMAVEVFEAARASGLGNLNRLAALAEAIDGFRSDPAFEDLHTAYFRCAKIAAKAGEKDETAVVDKGLFREAEEEGLLRDTESLEEDMEPLLADGDYTAALSRAAGIRKTVDDFFDAVMVMADDEALRRNRLALVRRTAALLLRLGDPIIAAAAPKD